jgi:hypothetical protein
MRGLAMNNAAATKSSIEAVIAEYSALRAENLQMQQAQWNIFALQVTAVAAIFSFSLSSNSRTGFLLILPVISYALSRRLLGMTEEMDRLSTYIAEELAPKVHGGFGFERWNLQVIFGARSGERYRILRDLYDPLAIIFPWVSIAALAWVAPYVLLQPHLTGFNRLMLGMVWFAGLIFSLLTFDAFKRRADQKKVLAAKG